MLKRPMKAPTDPITDVELKSLHYPIVGSPKLDGFRCLVDERGGLTSSMKPFTNRFVAETLKNPIFNGLDGEIIVGTPFKENEDDDVFHRTSGPIRRFDGEPDFKLFVFDDALSGDMSYQKRWIEDLPHWKPVDNRIVVLEQKLLYNADEVIAYETAMVLAGYEGAMIRSLDGKYKQGRCTLNEMNIFKRKPFDECEAEIIGLEEQMANLNEKITDSRGLSHRSSHQENKVPKNTLGMFIMQSPLWEKSFKAGTGRGFDDKKKKEIWDNKEAYIGQIGTVKYQRYGSVDRPRMPKVIKIRPKWDLSE